MKPQNTAAIASLKQKIEWIMALYEQSKADNAALKQQLETISLELNTYKTEKQTLENKVQKMQMAGAFQASDEDAREAKLKIGKIIREIDKCLAMLNR